MAQKKNRRVAKKGVVLGQKIFDDPMVEIASYGQRPLSWNTDTRDRYSCTPTNVSYRTLREPGAACPIEARFAEGLCCSSTRLNQTHTESLWFLRQLKAIDDGAGQAWIERTPPNLRRILDWIKRPTNASDIGAVDTDVHVLVHTDRDRYWDLVKFAMMSESDTRVRVRLPNSDIWQLVYFSSVVHVVYFSVLYEDAAQITTQLPGGVDEFNLFARQLVRLHPIHARRLFIKPYDPNTGTFVEIADITRHFETGVQRGWQLEHVILAYDNLLAVVESNTDIVAEIQRLFEAMKSSLFEAMNSNSPIRAIRAHINVRTDGEIVLPLGYTALALQAGDVEAIGSAIEDTLPDVKKSHHRVDVVNNEDLFSIDFVHQSRTFHVGVHWIVTQDVFEIIVHY